MTPINGGQPRHPDEAASEMRDHYTRKAREAQDAGRAIPAVPVYLDGLSPQDRETARSSIESSDTLLRRSRSRIFSMPALPWKH